MARAFNSGLTQYATIASGFNALATPFTVSCWINVITIGGAFFSYFGPDHAGTNNLGVQLRLNLSGAVELLQANVAIIGTSSNTISANVWYPSIASFDGTNWKIYLNSTLTSGTSGATVSADTPYIIGATGNNTGSIVQPWGGNLADVAVWNVILTNAEMLALSGGQRPPMVRPKALIGWWPLDGLQSPEPDLSGSANNATLTGPTATSGPSIALFTPRWPSFILPSGQASMIFQQITQINFTANVIASTQLTIHNP